MEPSNWSNIQNYSYYFCLFLAWFFMSQSTIFQSGQVFLGWISTKQQIKCLALGYIKVTATAVKLEPATLWSPLQRSTYWATAWFFWMKTMQLPISPLEIEQSITWLTSVCDPFRADTRGSINIGRYGSRELRRTGTVRQSSTNKSFMWER